MYRPHKFFPKSQCKMRVRPVHGITKKLRMMYYSVMTQAYSEKEIPSSPNRSRTYNLPITSSDVLPLSYRRLVGAKAIKLGSWDKHPAYCLDLNVNEWHIRNDRKCDGIF